MAPIVGDQRWIYGMQLPIQTLTRTLVDPWEDDASVADLVTVAQKAEATGHSFVGVCDHVAIPDDDYASRMTTTWYDTVATLCVPRGPHHDHPAALGGVDRRLPPPAADGERLRHPRPPLGRSGRARHGRRPRAGRVRGPRRRLRPAGPAPRGVAAGGAPRLRRHLRVLRRRPVPLPRRRRRPPARGRAADLGRRLGQGRLEAGRAPGRRLHPDGQRRRPVPRDRRHDPHRGGRRRPGRRGLRHRRDARLGLPHRRRPRGPRTGDERRRRGPGRPRSAPPSTPAPTSCTSSSGGAPSASTSSSSTPSPRRSSPSSRRADAAPQRVP